MYAFILFAIAQECRNGNQFCAKFAKFANPILIWHIGIPKWIAF